MGPIKRPGPPPAKGPRPVIRSDSGAWVDGHLIDIIALGVAAGAFWQPGTWLAFVVVACVGMGAVRSALADGKITGADLVAVPARAVARSLKLLTPSILIKGAFLAALILVLSVLIPAAFAVLPWLLAHGSEGALVAARLGARAHVVQFIVAAVCFLAVRGVGTGRVSRVAELKRRTGRMTEGGVSTLAVGVLLVALLLATVPPSGGGMFTGADGLGWLPSSFREPVDTLRDSIVTSEVDALGQCFSEKQAANWFGIHTQGNAIDQSDVAQFTADQVPPAESMIVVALSAHNQLAPWVEQIDLVGPDETLLLSVDRTKLRTDVPVTSTDALKPALVVGDAVLPPPEIIDQALLLECSVSAIQ